MAADEGDESEGAVRRVHAGGVRLSALLVTCAATAAADVPSRRRGRTTVGHSAVQDTDFRSGAARGLLEEPLSQAHIRLRMDGRRSAHPFIDLRRVGFAPLPRVTLDVTSR